MSTYQELITRHRETVFTEFLRSGRRLRWSAERLAMERERRLRDLLEWSAERSPFWRDRLANYNLATFTEADLPSLPILTKAELMENFDAAVTDPTLTLDRVNRYVEGLRGDAYLDDQYRVIATSGTTGALGLFVYGWDEWATFVVIATRWSPPDSDPGAPVGTFFAAETKHISGALHAFSKDFSGDGERCVTHLPASLPLPEIVAGLNTAQPTVLRGYPSVMHLLAFEALAGRLDIHPVEVSTCGEQCTEEARSAVRSAWGIEIYDCWGCSEGIYAFPCGVGEGMHLPDDLAIVEGVDQSGTPVPAGNASDKILLTNLYNRTQPLIRFEITDALTVLDEPCPCGCAHRRITDIKGRTKGVFLYPGGVAVHFLGMQSILLSDPSVVDMQVVQTQRGATVTLISRGTLDTRALQTALEELMSRSGLAHPEVTMRQVDSLDRLWSGKRRQFEPLDNSV